MNSRRIVQLIPVTHQNLGVEFESKSVTIKRLVIAFALVEYTNSAGIPTNTAVVPVVRDNTEYCCTALAQDVTDADGNTFDDFQIVAFEV